MASFFSAPIIWGFLCICVIKSALHLGGTIDITPPVIGIEIENGRISYLHFTNHDSTNGQVLQTIGIDQIAKVQTSLIPGAYAIRINTKGKVVDNSTIWATWGIPWRDVRALLKELKADQQ